MNNELQKYISQDCELYIVKDEFMINLIERYSLKINNIYKDMLNPFFENLNCKSDFLNSIEKIYGYKNKYKFDFSKITEEEQTSIFKMIEHIRNMGIEWGVATHSLFKNKIPYDLNKNNPEITNSWKIEYSQFELIRIYKTFDWKNNIMIHYGY